MEMPKRLEALRAKMLHDNIGAVLIRVTDRYFNEYVPSEQNQRAWISGFTGSAGDALITQKTATLYVDGRYTLQAAQQAPDFAIKVAPLGSSIQSQWLQAISMLSGLSNPSIYIDTQLVSRSLYSDIKIAAGRANLEVRNQAESYLKSLGFSSEGNPSPSMLREIGEDLCGESVGNKHHTLNSFLTTHELDALLVVHLDEIAWLTNLRGSDFTNQATFAARAIVFQDKIIVGVEKFSGQKSPPGVELVSEADMWRRLADRAKKTKIVVGVDESAAPEDVLAHVESHASIRGVVGPIKALKAHKNVQELLHMRQSFARADRVVFKVQNWLCEQVSSGAHVTEAQVAVYLSQSFAESGTTALSFAPICAAGKNAAVIHYGTPDPNTPIKKGDLFLLDVGGIYEGGYSTDLTRTFLVGDQSTVATLQQKHLFTTVLKGAIAGLSARLPKTANGAQLDAMVRAPIWQAGFDYAHGTGHGVGINVHESPPTVAIGSSSNFLPGHVFSIEPGIYFEKFGGIRIENLATIVDDPVNPGYLCVLPLTFAPLDSRLIDTNQLTEREKRFLAYFSEGFEFDQTQMPRLPA